MFFKLLRLVYCSLKPKNANDLKYMAILKTLFLQSIQEGGLLNGLPQAILYIGLCQSLDIVNTCRTYKT